MAYDVGSMAPMDHRVQLEGRERPNQELTMTQKIIAFLGVPYRGSTFPNQAGRYPSRLMEYIRREEAR